jgi:anti-sigma B factor antagonist
MAPDPADASSSGLKLRTYKWNDSTVVQCSGRLTAENAGALKSHVRSLIPTAKGIIIDLKEVARMDSAGLGTLVGLYISAKKANCEFLLANYNQSIKDLLGLTNLLSIFENCAHTGMRIP